MMKSIAFACALFLSVALTTVNANRQVVVYWGQGPDGETGLKDYCQDSSIDILVISFIHDFPFYSGTQLPNIDVSSVGCKAFSSANPKFQDCSKAVGPDITYCQSQGKKVIISLGGASGNIGFTSDSQAVTAADTFWNMFLGGTYAQRPFGTAILDGVDLDVEQGNSNGFAAFLTQLRTHFTSQTAKQYIIGAAPQCPYPDDWMGPGSGTALQTAWFDYVWVQFYNNNCGLNKYPGSQFNFATWANWAKTTSINPNVQILIGAPASSDSAGSGYVSAATLQTIHNDMAAKYPTIYGGMMLWEAQTAKENNDFAGQLAAFVHDGSAPSTPAPVPTPAATPTPVPATPSTKTTTTGSKSSTSTGRVSTSTTGKGSKTTTTTTTGKGSKSTTTTTGKGSKTTTTTTGNSPVISSPPTSPAPQSSPSAGSCSTIGYMKCASSSTYQICDHNLWSVAMPCPSSLTCTPSGNYIYCDY